MPDPTPPSETVGSTGPGKNGKMEEKLKVPPEDAEIGTLTVYGNMIFYRSPLGWAALRTPDTEINSALGQEILQLFALLYFDEQEIKTTLQALVKLKLTELSEQHNQQLFGWLQTKAAEQLQIEKRTPADFGQAGFRRMQDTPAPQVAPQAADAADLDLPDDLPDDSDDNESVLIPF